MIASLLFAAAVTATPLTDDGLAAQAAILIQAKNDTVPAEPVIGLHHGVKVLLMSRCSDICPIYTVRIIHYDLEPGDKCLAVGGIKETVLVPMGVASNPQAFCVPEVLSRKQLFAGHPYQDRKIH